MGQAEPSQCYSCPAGSVNEHNTEAWIRPTDQRSMPLSISLMNVQAIFVEFVGPGLAA